MSSFRSFGEMVLQRQRWVLIAMLAVLHVTLISGITTIGRTAWVVDVGLFLLWQPFVRAQRHIGAMGVALVAAGLCAGVLLFDWWLLLFWTVALAALVGGWVMFIDRQLSRLFYLSAFTYLLLALLLWVVPQVVPGDLRVEPLLDRVFLWALPVLFVLMAALPAGEERVATGNRVIDLVYSLFIFLLVTVLVLGSLAFMLLRHASYGEALFYTLIAIASMLLLIGWAWNPRPGFSGIGAFFSRYLLSVGLPFEKWLHQLTAQAENESDPERFVGQALAGMAELPWVDGGVWQSGRSAGEFGVRSRHQHDFRCPPLTLSLFTRYPLSPALVWHFHLLVQLAAEYYQARLRARELQQVSYLRAVHETGARLTHDVKNLLQSLNNLCYVAQTGAVEDAGELKELLQRQLPQISQRLRQTLDKLQKPDAGCGEMASAEVWWDSLCSRYAADRIDFVAPPLAADARVPVALFDSVADNLLQNALAKRRHEPALVIRARLSGDGAVFTVADDGSAVPQRLLADLLYAPLASDNGLGIGLYHAAQQAVAQGFTLRLASNLAGAVRFELQRVADQLASG